MRTQSALYYLSGATGMLLIALVIGYWTPMPGQFASHPPNTEPQCQVPVCVSDSGWHSNIILPIANPVIDWRKELPLGPMIQAAGQPIRYLYFGWGDRTFYRQPPARLDQLLITGFAALFLPTPSVMKVQGYAQLPYPYLRIKCTQISNQEYRQLGQYIRDSFQRNAQGKVIDAGFRPQLPAQFYEAKGSYSLLNNCNHWTARGLRTTEITTPRWPSLSSAILLHFHHPCQVSRGFSNMVSAMNRGSQYPGLLPSAITNQLVKDSRSKSVEPTLNNGESIY